MDLTKVPLSDRVFNLQEAAQFLGRSVDTLERYISEGKLHPHKIGVSPTFLQSELVRSVATEALAAPPVKPNPGRRFTKKGHTQ